MTISKIQKKKFLDNIYKLMYSTGTSTTNKVVRQPSELEVKREFDQYFSENRIGLPLRNDINLLRNTQTTNPDLMNIFMARSILNLEVLYDSIHENGEDMMSVVTVLGKRLNSLRDKRVALEKKLDEILFANSNTDGYFYSFSDSFANLSNVDLNLSTCFIDTEHRSAKLPTLKNNALDFRAPGRINLNNIKYDMIFNGNTAATQTPLPNANNIFDGLNDTLSTVTHTSSTLGACAMVLTIPLNTPFVVSSIDGKLNTSSAIVTIAEIIGTNTTEEVQYRRKQSNSDYDKFSFNFIPQQSGTIRITLIKYEPDITFNDRTVDKYHYKFDIKDLIVSGQYYDKEAMLISSPITIDSGNENKIIDAVSIEAANANPSIGQINYFVAQNIPNAVNVSDFNWVPIASSSSGLGVDQVVSFSKSIKYFKSISSVPTSGNIFLSPIIASGALTEINPSSSIYRGVSVYRVGIIAESDTPYNPYLLDSVNRISFKYTSYSQGLYSDLGQWSSLVNATSSTNQVFDMGSLAITNVPSIPISLNLNEISGFMQTNLLVDIATQVNHVVSKSGGAIDWDVAVYLNGVKIADIPAGQVSPTQNTTWNLIEGINRITITFDSLENASGTISLMDGVSITNYGTPFLSYYSYVDPFDFRTNRSIEDSVFTIDKYLGNKEILCRKQIKDNSRLVYYSNNNNPVESIRFRADFTRPSNPFGTPVLNGYRVKFKNGYNELS
jgi:hypothetical protein